MMYLVIVTILTVLGIPVSVCLQVLSSYIRNRSVWDNTGLVKSTWLLIGALAVSALCAVVSLVQAVCYSIIDKFTRIPQGWPIVWLFIECIIHAFLAGIAMWVYTKEKDMGNIVFWPSQR